MKKMMFTMRLLGLLLLVVGRVGEAWGQAPGWDWAVSPGAGGANAMAVDAVGNVYVTGHFAGTATFGTITLTSTSTNQTDAFVAKCTSSGTYQWVAQVGGTTHEHGTAIAVDAAGNVYVTGDFSSPLAAFGPTISLTKTTNSPLGSKDVFVAKLNAAGVWQWAVKGGGSEQDVSNGLAIDGSGNVYVTGFFSSSTATFGPAVANPIMLTNSAPRGDDNTFVAKLSAAGIYQWATSATGDSNRGNAVVVDSNGQVYINGYSYNSSVTFGTFVLSQPVSPAGARIMFVARLTAAGAWDWAIGTGNNSAFPDGMALDGSGNLLIIGAFSGQLTLGATTLTSDGGTEDVFVAKLNPAGPGGWTWAVRAGGLGHDYGVGVALDGNSNAYVTGAFSGPTASFGPTTLTNAGTYDVFVAKLTPTGMWQWATRAGGTAPEAGFGVTVESNGAVCVTGWFQSNPASFGSISLPNNTPGSFNIFLARLGTTGVGLPEATTPQSLTLAPNPAHHTVQLTGAPSRETTATLLDALGRAVRTCPLSPGTSTLDLRGLAPGVYTVRAGAATRRLLVE